MAMTAELYAAEPDEPIQYAEGNSPWVPYTGPKGGRGWQHIQTGEIIYGEKPGTREAAEPEQPKAESPPSPEKPPPAEWKSQSAGGKTTWKNPQTGETVLSDKPPSSASAAETIAKAKGKPAQPKPQPEPKPAAQPGTKPAAQPVDKEFVKQLDSLPDGTQLHGWTKETPPSIKMAVWTNKNHPASSADMIRQVGADKLKEAIGAIPPPAPDPDPAARGKPQARAYSPDEQEAVNSVSAIMGIPPGDVGNNPRMQTFLTRTARLCGFDPDSAQGDSTDKTVAAAQFLASRQPHLESLVSMAQGYGWHGGTARELAHRARHAGLHLVKAAQERGYQQQSSKESENLAGAMDYLQRYERLQQARKDAQGQQQHQSVRKALAFLQKRIGGTKLTLMHIAMAAIGFFVAYSLVRRMRRRRNR